MAIPGATFTGQPLSGPRPTNVTFTDLSTGDPTEWLWSFGDGTTSTGQNPIHGYFATGSYDVQLITTNITGSNTGTESGYISISAATTTYPVGPPAIPSGGVVAPLSSDIYMVGPNQTYKEVQEAINVLIANQGVSPFTSTKRILIVEDGVYKKFTIPSNSLRPQSSARLEIMAASGINAVISGDLTAYDVGSDNGCLIGDNIPYVTITRLYIKNFIKGITCAVNSHDLIATQNVISNCSNTGIWIYQSNRAQIYNNIIVNCKFCIASTLVNNISIVFNTLFNSPEYVAADNVCVYAELQKERAGFDSHGSITIYNNIIFSAAGTCVVVNERDLGYLLSDNNNIYTTSGKVARIRTELPEAGVSYDNIYNLNEWRAITSTDSLSISDHPIFISDTLEFGGLFFDFSLLPISPCIQAGVTLAGDPSGLLLPYIDDTYFSTDVLGNPRDDSPTIGANEITVADGFLDMGIFTPTAAGEQSSVVCGTSYTAVELSASQYADAVECWFPQVKSGHFFIREKPYYLYADKQAYTLSQITRTTFRLSHPLKRGTVKLYVSGKEITDTKYWEIGGNIAHINHLDLDIGSLNDDIVIQGKFQEWSGNGFILKDATFIFKLREGEQTYILPSNPKDLAPVVITDDTITLLDDTGLLPMEFKTSWDGAREETELLLNPNTNIWLNPQFDYGIELADTLDALTISTGDFTTKSNPIRRDQEDTTKRHKLAKELSVKANDTKNFKINTSFLARTIDTGSNLTMTHHGYELPEDYEIITDGRVACRDVVQVDQKRAIRPLMGRQFLLFDIPTGDTGTHTVSQDVKIDPDSSYYFTTYVTAPNATGDANVTFEFLDHNRITLNTSGPHTYPMNNLEVTPTSTGDYWERVGIRISSVANSTPNKVEDTISKFDTGLVSIDSSATYMVVKLSAETGNPVGFDCMQLEERWDPKPYNRVPRGEDVTVEYEGSDRGFYTISDLSIAPIRNPQTNGFLQITSVPAGQFDTGAPVNNTVLTDWFWPNGRLNHLPWSKTKGLNKWNRTSHFSPAYNGVSTTEITWDIDIVEAEDVTIIPIFPTSVQDSSGDVFSVFVKDRHGNPYSFNPIKLELFDDQGEFPGWLSYKEFGIYSKLGQVFTAETNSKGTISTLFYPPSQEDIEYRGDKPTIFTSVITGDLPSNNRQYGTVGVNYAVSDANHGNISMHDQFNNRISLDGAETQTGFLVPQSDDVDFSHYQLQEYPVFGSLKVFNNMTGDTGTYDRQLEQSLDPHLSFGQFYFNESDSSIVVKGITNQDIKVTYKRRLAWTDPNNNRKIHIDKTALDSATGDIVVNYDASISLKVTAEAPLGTIGLPAKYKQIELTAQNKFVGRAD